MHDHTNKVELVVVCWVRHLDFIHGLIIISITSLIFLPFFSFLLLLLLLIEVLLGVFAHIHFHLELEVVVQFPPDHQIEVKVEPLQSGEHVARHGLQTCALQCVNLLVALLTVVLVILVQKISRDECFHTFLEVLLVLHWDAKGEECFVTSVSVRASLADDFVGKLASEVILNRLLLRCALNGTLKSIHEHC